MNSIIQKRFFGKLLFFGEGDTRQIVDDDADSGLMKILGLKIDAGKHAGAEDLGEDERPIEGIYFLV